MNTSILPLLAGTLALSITLHSQPANALETYTDNDKQQFMDWCTGAKSATESMCSCTVKRLAQSIPATALTQFLTSQGSFSLSAAAVSTGAAVTQALVSCSG